MVDLVSKATMHHCVNVCVLLEVSTGDGSFWFLSTRSFFPSPSRRAFRKPLPDTGMGRGNWRLSVASEGVEGYVWGKPGKPAGPAQLAGGSPPCPLAAPGFLAGKYLTHLWA